MILGIPSGEKDWRDSRFRDLSVFNLGLDAHTDGDLVWGVAEAAVVLGIATEGDWWNGKVRGGGLWEDVVYRSLGGNRNRGRKAR